MSSTRDWTKYFTGEIHKDSSKEILIPTSYGKSAGKLWGPLDGEPIIALHGWQDCCTTFDRLIPLLPRNYTVLAMDLPGHGHSDHHAPRNMYHSVSYMLWLKELLDLLQLDKFILLLHSMSVIVFTPFATLLQPHRVQKVIALDVVHPSTLKHIGTTPNFLELMEKCEKQEASKTPPPLDRDIAIRKILEQRPDLDPTTVEYLMTRITKPLADGRVTFTRDPRLALYLHMDFLFSSFEAFEKMARLFKGEWLVVLAKDSIYSPRVHPDKMALMKKAFRKNAAKYECFYVEGGHYVHLSHPERIAPMIRSFLAVDHVISRL